MMVKYVCKQNSFAKTEYINMNRTDPVQEMITPMEMLSYWMEKFKYLGENLILNVDKKGAIEKTARKQRRCSGSDSRPSSPNLSHIRPSTDNAILVQ